MVKVVDIHVKCRGNFILFYKDILYVCRFETGVCMLKTVRV